MELTEKERLRRLVASLVYRHEEAVRAFRRVAEKVPYRFDPDDPGTIPTAEELKTALELVETARAELAEAYRQYGAAGGFW